ncbi:MAG: PEP-CTERM sorting domain-containing protein [Nostoc sp.]
MTTVNVLKKLSMAAAGAAVIALGTVGTAQAATFNFSFSNVDGAVNGNVGGTIQLPDGDGTFAATSVVITSLPDGLGLTAPLAPSSIIQNVFSVVAGQINLAGTQFVGLINPSTALALNTTIVPVGTFLDALNGASLGATGVQDIDSSTLTFTSASAAAVPEPASVIGILGLGAFGVTSLRKRKQATAVKA